MITTLTEPNQVTVPEEIVKQMGLKQGTQVEWTPGAVPGTFVVDLVPEKRKLLARAKEIGKTFDRHVLDELIEARSREE